MTLEQQVFIIIFALFNLLIFFRGVNMTVHKRNSFGLTEPLVFIGAFVWGDVVVLAPFWIIVSIISFVAQNWYLFLLFVSVFWTVRSIGETMYWFNQQFSTINRNPPEKLKGYRFTRNSSIWFIYQLIYQCIAVISLVASMYFANQWLKG